MNPEYSLDYIAETTLPPDESWVAARQLGRRMVQHMRSTYTPENAHYFHVDDVDDVLLGVSEQPDLEGEVIITMHQASGTWCVNRQAEQQSLHTLKALPLFKGSYVGFNVMHAETAQPLLQVALPITPITGYMMRHGYMTTHAGSPYHVLRVMDRYNHGDVSFEPRRVQVAAWLTRHIIAHNVAPSYFLLSPEEEQAFLDKHFPYQNLLLTSGGGKTVYQRAAR